MSIFTSTIHGRGWTVKQACEHWGISYRTYNRRCNNSKVGNQLLGMCKGLEDKL